MTIKKYFQLMSGIGRDDITLGGLIVGIIVGPFCLLVALLNKIFNAKIW